MNKKEQNYFKDKLTKEKELLKGELETLGRSDKRSAMGWEATSGPMEVDNADENEVADRMEELEDNQGIMDKLEGQMEEVDAALKRIEDGAYGICEISNHPIEQERLEANPSARTCITHMKKVIS